MSREYFAWVERYRPQTLDECILTKELRQTFEGILKRQDTTNLLFQGRAGTGKTTVARALTNQLDAITLVINASLENGIDVLRTKIQDFATSYSLSGKRKFVVLDEADHLSPAVQPALRNFMEEFSAVCGFILTCNYPQRIIPALHSRCSIVDFKIPMAEKPGIAKAFLARSAMILNHESVVFDQKVLTQVIVNYFPDFRRTLNELQRFSASGTLSDAILAQVSDRDIALLFDALKKKSFQDVRKWLVSHEDMDETAAYRMLYEQVPVRIAENCLASAIVLMADYAARAGHSADRQLNLLACLVELMQGAVWQ
jgi:DNA polymerase III delta prime subunit